MARATPRSGTRRVGRPPGPAADPIERRHELLEAATRTIRRVGPNASMDDIAAEAGLTKPILYSNFGDKAGLAAALAEHNLTELMPKVLAAFDGDFEPRRATREAIDIFITFVERDPEVYRFLVRGVGALAERSFNEQRLVAEFGLRLAQVLRTQLHHTEVDTGPAEVWAFAILGLVFAGAEWWLIRPTMSRDALVDYLTALVWSGLSGGIDGSGFTTGH